MSQVWRTFILIIVLTLVAGFIALPETFPIRFSALGREINREVQGGLIDFNFFGNRIQRQFTLKQGLDIQGGMQIVLQADMSQIPEADRETALTSVKEIMARRVDLFGISEPSVQTSQLGSDYRILIELPGVEDSSQALQLVGTTAQLDFKLPTASPSAEATQSAVAFFNSFQPTGLTGKQLKRAAVQFDPQTGQPIVGIEFNEEGSQLFSKITTENVGQVLAIFMDNGILMMPQIQEPIVSGQASINGSFTVEQANQLAIQLNAGALPVPVKVIEQRTIGASLGQQSVQASIRAGLIGIGLVMLFMILYYGLRGVLASLALVLYAVYTIAIYKLLGVTLTLPGIAGLLLSIGMAVDATILVFERMKEELRIGRSFSQAMELGFGRAWDSIKDANLATILTALILINPLNLPFLNTSGLVRGFGMTLLVGVLISLFTGVVVVRTLMRLFLKDTRNV